MSKTSEDVQSHLQNRDFPGIAAEKHCIKVVLSGAHYYVWRYF